MQLAKALPLGADQLPLRPSPPPFHHAVDATLREAPPHLTDPAVARVAQLRDRVGLQPHADERGDGDVAPDRVALPKRRDGQPAAEDHHVLPGISALEERLGDVDQLPVRDGFHAMQ